MKKVLLFLLLSCLSAQATTKTPTQIQAEINSQITLNGYGAITGPVLNNILMDITNSYFPAQAPAVWTLQQNFFLNPILQNCQGIIYGNGQSPITCGTPIPNSALLNSSLTIAGHLVSLGGIQPLASTDLTDTANLGRLNAINTWALGQTFTSAATFTAGATFNGSILDQSSVVGSAAKFWNPSYFVTNPATGIVHKINRLLIGEASLTGSQIPASPASWVETYIPNLVADSQLAVGASIGTLAVTGYARTGDYRTWAGSTSGGAEGGTFVGVNNDTTAATTPIAVGVVGIGFHLTGVVGITLGGQMDVNAQSNCALINPFSGIISNTCSALGLTSGAYALGLAKPSAAFYVGKGTGGGPAFSTGGVYFSGALDPAVGAGGNGVWAEIANGMSLRSSISSGVTGAELYALVSGNYFGWRSSGGFSGPAFMSSGGVPTPTGTCAVNTQGGGTSSGTFKANGACAAGTVILAMPAGLANTGWHCKINDETTPADVMNQTAYTATSVTFTGTMAANDQVTFGCTAF